jgi:hypothetical protein
MISAFVKFGSCNPHFGHPLHAQSVYHKTLNLCMGSAKMCLVIAWHILVRQLCNLGKMRQTILLYSLRQGSIVDLTSSSYHLILGPPSFKNVPTLGPYPTFFSWSPIPINFVIRYITSNKCDVNMASSNRGCPPNFESQCLLIKQIV